MNWISSNIDLILELTIEHVRLSVIPIILSFVLAIPLGWLANRTRTLRAIIIGTGSLLYTIPSLPLFVILPIVLGTRVLSDINLVVALTIYGVAVMMRSATDALGAVDKVTLDAADAMGFSPWTRFWRVDVPLAGPVLLAGIRVVSVSTIALVSVGVIIGSVNLGYLFQTGKQRDILVAVVTGIVLTLILALIFDGIILLVARIVMPWNRTVTETAFVRAAIKYPVKQDAGSQ